MVGILAAESSDISFAYAFQELSLEAVKPVDPSVDSSKGLSQVHALNCLKDIFKSTKLGQRSEAYLSPALKLAGDCLSSDM